MRPWISITVAVLGLCLPTAMLSAQADPDTVHVHNQCRLALQIIERGHPQPHEKWAYEFVARCGATAGTAIAQRQSELRTSSDTTELRLLAATGSQLRDNAILRVSLDVAGDRGASTVARPFAFLNLIYLVSDVAEIPGFDPWHTEGLGCIGASTHRIIMQGAALDADFRDRVRAVAERVTSDPDEPPAVRAAALCTLSYGGWSRARVDW
jgi:hypothetical protein